MKKSLLTISLLMLLVLTVSAQKKKVIAPVNEVDAIKAAIEKETKAFFAVDYDGWMSSWVHAPYAYWSFVDSSGVSQHDGWKAIEVAFTDYFITSKPAPNMRIERTWEEVRVYGNGAFARFTQRVFNNGVSGGEQTEIRVLEKDPSNVWKIVLVAVLRDRKDAAQN